MNKRMFNLCHRIDKIMIHCLTMSISTKINRPASKHHVHDKIMIMTTRTKVMWQKVKSQNSPLYSLGGSINCMFCLGVRLPNLSFLRGGQGPPSNTMCHWIPQLYLPNGIKNLSNGLSRGHICDRRQTDRTQYGEMSSDRCNCLQCKKRFHPKIIIK